MSGKDKFSKVILLGEEGVGKTSILVRFTEDQFYQVAPDGIEWKEKRVQIDNETPSLRSFDTASQESFRTITSSYYHGTDAVILVYDITKKESFQKIAGWMNDVALYGKDYVPKALIGNKVDLEVNREVTIGEAKELQSKHNIDVLLETSAYSGQNIQQIFVELARAMRPKVNPIVQPVRLEVNQLPMDDKKKKCSI
eukprot:TRINITY_DN7304_c0_g1_i2.p1 TRINITY_DN7304_c0_g1~~TRINITY_DN7304_c0_g1_i2.p1  ORF type:complete len:197 (+),score=33.70 TRINITY_DN7304_c0_g1_i2:320-910(+)